MSKCTKIVATIGPASLEEGKLETMILGGMNVARLNFSHSDHDWHNHAIQMIREAELHTGIPVAIIADLQGPRIRTSVKDSVEVFEGEELSLYEVGMNREDEGKYIAVDQAGILSQLQIGQRVLIEDGRYAFNIIGKNSAGCRIKSINKGVIKDHKGMNFPGAHLSLSSLTEKDREDVEFAVEKRVEYLALSFVGTVENVLELRQEIARHISSKEEYAPQIIVKIERQQALDNLEEIIRETDVVMVARGDLAMEAGASRVAVLQKQIIQKSLVSAKPVIVATQMLESMITSPQPTRAEISDVSNAVIDHTDAVMLSGETANGAYPVECVEMMAAIIRDTEESTFDDVSKTVEIDLDSQYPMLIRSVYEFSKNKDIRAFFVVSCSGETARLLSHFRPRVPIYVATYRKDVQRQMALYWGVRSFLFENTQGERNTIKQLIDQLLSEKILQKGDMAVCIFRSQGEDTKTVELREGGVQ